MLVLIGQNVSIGKDFFTRGALHMQFTGCWQMMVLIGQNVSIGGDVFIGGVTGCWLMVVSVCLVVVSLDQNVWDVSMSGVAVEECALWWCH